MKLTFGFIFVFSYFHLFSQNMDYRFERIGVRDGLPQSEVQQIMQDSKGFIWIATRNGLAKYDGYRFTTYRPKLNDDGKSLNGNIVSGIGEDKSHRLWISTVEQGLNWFHLETGEISAIKAGSKGLLSNDINNLLVGKKGNVWVSNAEGMQKYNAESQTFETILTKKSKGARASLKNNLYEDNNNHIWLFDENRLYKWEQAGNGFELIYQLGNDDFKTVFIDKQNRYWLGNVRGLTCYDPQTQTQKSYEYNTYNQQNALNTDVKFIFIDSKENFWVGTTQNGLYLFDPISGKFYKNYRYNEQDPFSISSNLITHIFEDTFGVLWIGTPDGVNKLDLNQKPFRLYTQLPSNKNTLSDKEITAIYEDSKGYVWLGTWNKGVNRLDRKTGIYDYYQFEDKNPNSICAGIIAGIVEDNQGDIWINSWSGCVCRIDSQTKKIKRYQMGGDEGVLKGYSQRSITKDKQGRIWTGSMDGGLEYYDPEKDRFVQRLVDAKDKQAKVPLSNVVAIYQSPRDKEGIFWVGNYQQGMCKVNINTGTCTYFERKPQDSTTLRHPTAISFLEDSQGRLWVGTQGGGLHLLMPDGKSFKNYSVENSDIPDNTVYGILEDKSGNLWLSTENGIAKFNPTKNSFTNYDEKDGLQSNEFKWGAFFQNQAGEIFFGGSFGFNSFLPAQIKNNPIPAKPVLTSFKIFNQEVPVGKKKDGKTVLTNTIAYTKEITLDYTDNIISLEFAALHNSDPQGNLYAYQLEGVDMSWNEVKADKRFVSYSNLPRNKKLLFRLKVANEDGVWSAEEAQLTIYVSPPLWETWWFRTFFTLLILGTAYYFYSVRTKFLEKQNLKLEKQVLERTQEIEEKAKDLKIANQNIKQKNEELLSSEEELRQNMEELETNQEELQAQKEQLEDAFQLLHLQNSKVNDSIRYAQRIQNAILPHEDILATAFSEHFVIFKPKDVVSGDFYWYLEIQNGESGNRESGMNTMSNDELLMTNEKQQTINNKQSTAIQNKKKFLAVVDCTGHGVPGAFMSMIGNTLLYEIINTKGIFEPHLILEQLHEGILNSLNKKDANMKDGMDIALCCIEKQANNEVKIQFGGAKRPLYYLSNNQLVKVKADRKSIGQSYTKDIFTLNEITLQVGDTLYMTTDGWIDTINPGRARFGSQKFQEMLLQGINLPLNTQKEIFSQILEDYEQGTEQRDDVLLVGVKL